MPSRPLALVIDDTDVVRQMYVSVLRLEGFTVEEAHDGQQGLEKAVARTRVAGIRRRTPCSGSPSRSTISSAKSGDSWATAVRRDLLTRCAPAACDETAPLAALPNVTRGSLRGPPHRGQGGAGWLTDLGSQRRRAGLIVGVGSSP